MEDKLLVLRFKRGNAEALEQIYDKYKKDLFILAIALLNDTSAAEDVVHNVFVSFIRTIAKFQPTGSLKGFLLTCTANHARNFNKAKHQQSISPDSEETVNTDSDEPASTMICNEQLQQLSDAMAQLPFDQREVIMLHFHAGMTFKKIAALQNNSINTTKSRYQYGIDKLRAILDGEVIK